MSYWICLTEKGTMEDDDSIVEVEEHQEGGTIAIGGCDEAEINVTYNYASFFSFRKLHGMKSSDSIPLLEKAVEDLGTERSDNYWDSTPGNAGHTCNVLLRWARQHPEALWYVN